MISGRPFFMGMFTESSHRNLYHMRKPRKDIITKLTEKGCMEVISHPLHTNGYPVSYLPYYCPDGPKRIRQKQMCIHRYVYALHHGPIPKGMYVMHTCDNRLCINPSHLKLGTHLDNMADKFQKNRHAKGDTCGRRKINSDDVRQILADTTKTHAELAKQFNISRPQVTKIKGRKTWSYLQTVSV